MSRTVTNIIEEVFLLRLEMTSFVNSKDFNIDEDVIKETKEYIDSQFHDNEYLVLSELKKDIEKLYCILIISGLRAFN